MGLDGLRWGYFLGTSSLKQSKHSTMSPSILWPVRLFLLAFSGIAAYGAWNIEASAYVDLITDSTLPFWHHVLALGYTCIGLRLLQAWIMHKTGAYGLNYTGKPLVAVLVVGLLVLYYYAPMWIFFLLAVLSFVAWSGARHAYDASLEDSPIETKLHNVFLVALFDHLNLFFNDAAMAHGQALRNPKYFLSAFLPV